MAIAVLTLTAACGARGERVNAGRPTTTKPDTSATTGPPQTTSTVVIGDPTSAGGDPKVAGAAVTQFGTELFNALRADKNAVISPVSVAVAFAMLEPGANGVGKTELDHALHIADPAAFHASMAALRRSLESASAPHKSSGYDPGDLQIAISNATYMQAGYPLRPAYIGALGKYYGPVLKTVDFQQHGAEAVRDINQFISDGTRGHITKVLDENIDPTTVLALVNALYLKASWSSPFESAKTKRQPFTRRDGSKVTAHLMHGTSTVSTSGDGWVAARKFYSSRLAADFVLPDNRRFDDVANQLAAIFPKLERDTARGSTLVAPKVTTRFHEELKPAVKKLGINAVYNDGNLMELAGDPTLVVDQAVHATFLAMDEKGTEAAAATVITGSATGAELDPPTPVPVILDRPFFFRIVDTETGATLFIGQILDPTAG